MKFEDFNPLLFPDQLESYYFPDYVFKVWKADNDIKLEETNSPLVFSDTLGCNQDSIKIPEDFNNDLNNRFTYNWYLNGDLVSKVKSPMLKFPKSGLYNLKIEAINNTDSLTFKGTIFKPVCKEGKQYENINFGFMLYPNPSATEIYLNSPQAFLDSNQKVQINIVNPLGELVLSKYYRKSNEKIDISEFPIGIYLFVVRLNNTIIFSKKFIKI